MSRDLASTFVVLQPDHTAVPVENGPGMDLRKPGEYVLVPRGVWHTARTAVATNMLFVTPGEGTENEPV